MKNKKTSKGFFFVLATLLILAYILTSISLWTKSMEISERAYAEKFKMSNLEIMANQISEYRVSKFADIAAYRALHQINEYSVNYPVKSGPENDPYLHVRNAFKDMISNGTLNPKDFENNPSAFSDNSRSLGGWFFGINETISATGMEVVDYYFSDFNISQTEVNELNYSFKVGFSITDKTNHAYLTRNYEIKNKLKLDGLTDPAIKRETNGLVNRQFFFLMENGANGVGPFDKPGDAVPNKIASGSEGQGWYYAAAIQISDAPNVPIVDRNSTILVGNYTEITDLYKLATTENPIDLNQFGAYILTNAPDEKGECDGAKIQANTFNAIECVNNKAQIVSSTKIEKPFIVIPDFTTSTAYNYNDGKDYAKTRILFVAKYSYDEIKSDPKKKFDSNAVVYDMEGLRDLAICGYYVKNPAAPSYLQRLFKNPYDEKDGTFGIETFAFGDWINGSDKDYPDSLSRLDRELFTQQNGNKVRGMPGCKNPEMCNSDTPIGHFRLGSDSSSEYLNETKAKIWCSDQNCKVAN